MYSYIFYFHRICILILGSNHPTILFTDHKTLVFPFRQNSNPKHRGYRFLLILMKLSNLHIVWTAEKNLSLSDMLYRNTPRELITRKPTVEIPQCEVFPCKRQNITTIGTQVCSKNRTLHFTNKQLGTFLIIL